MKRLLQFIAALLIAVFLYWFFNEALPQAQSVQQFRHQWNKDCLDAGGTIVTNGKGSPNYLCFGPDGRLLSTRN